MLNFLNEKIIGTSQINGHIISFLKHLGPYFSQLTYYHKESSKDSTKGAFKTKQTPAEMKDE